MPKQPEADQQTPGGEPQVQASFEPAPADQPSRRTVMKVVAVGVTGAAIGASSTSMLSRLPHSPPRKWRFFTDAEAAVVDAICEQIIPADEDPGARDAGVVNFIDKQLVGPYTRFQSRYRQGIAAVQATSDALFKKPFESLTSADQVAVLKALESGKAPAAHWQQQSSGEFFNMVVSHTMQGFYGSPRHGGNRDYVSYRMLGLSYPAVIGQNRYTKA